LNGTRSGDFGNDSHDLGNDPHDLGNDLYDLGNDSQDLGNDFHDLGNDLHDLGNDPQDLGNDPQDLGNDLHDLRNDSHDIGNDSHDLGHDSHDLRRGAQGLAISGLPGLGSTPRLRRGRRARRASSDDPAARASPNLDDRVLRPIRDELANPIALDSLNQFELLPNGSIPRRPAPVARGFPVTVPGRQWLRSWRWLRRGRHEASSSWWG
jgi:hypothetical protein